MGLLLCSPSHGQGLDTQGQGHSRPGALIPSMDGIQTPVMMKATVFMHSIISCELLIAMAALVL